MSAKVLILRPIGALLAISLWLPSLSPREVSRKVLTHTAYSTQIHSDTSPAGERMQSIDICLGLWEISDPAFCKDETEPDEEELPLTMVLPPSCSRSDCPTAKTTGLVQILERFASATGHIPLRC
jgi:hypothetical protein